GGAGIAFDFGRLGVGHVGVGRLDHGVDQIELLHHHACVGVVDLAGLHGAARYEHTGNVQAHGGHQHSRGDLVAVRDTDHGVSAVRVHHVFDRIGNEFARWQRIQHAAVTHRNTVVDRNRVEFLRHTARGLD